MNMYTGKILLSLILLITTKDLVIGQDFYLHENGVTIVCDNAEVGQNWNLDGWWYVKRSIDQITPENARTSCVSGIENMSELFRNEENFNEDISHWDVSSVTNMSFMFSGAREFNQDLGLWNVSSVIDMSEMFHNAKDFNQDIGEWNVSNVENMSFMFGDANNFNQNIGLWDVSKVKSMQYMFEYAWNFNSDINNWNVKNVEAMQYMFYHAESFNQPLSKWDISSAKDVGAMFYEAKSFDQDLSNWDLSNVTSTWNMLKNSNISTQNYSKLLIAWAQNDLPNNMLFDSTPLTYNPNAINARNKIKNEFKWDIIDNGLIEFVDSSNIELTYPENKSSDIPWKTSIRWEVKENVDYDSVQIQMYSDTDNDTSVFNIYSVESKIEAPLLEYGVTYNWRIRAINKAGNGPWTKENSFTVTNNQLIKLDTNGLTIICNDAPNGWTDHINGIIYTARDNLDGIGHEDLSKTCTSGITDMTDLIKKLYDGASFNENISHWDVSNVINMSNMFLGSDSLDQDLSSWDVSSVKNMTGMFHRAKNFNSAIGSWDVSSVEYFGEMFKSASKFNQNISTWNTSKAKNMGSMFYQASSFNQFIGDWNVSNVEEMEYMFNGASIFNQDIGSWDVSSVTDMRGMFHNAANFNQNLSYWDVSSVTDMTDMFMRASSFDQILWSWCVINVTNAVGFRNQSGLKSHFVPKWGTCPSSLDSPELVTPFNGQINVGTVTEFHWDKRGENPIDGEGAIKYHFQLTKGGFNSPIIDTSEVNSINILLEKPLEENTKYFWRVKSISYHEPFNSDWTNIFSFDTGIRTTIEEELIPQEYTLSQNYPNPFNPSTQIQYALPEATEVTLEVFNSVGQKVMDLVNGQKSAGYHTATFDASGLSSGVYLYKLTTSSFTETKKMLLIK